MTSNQLHAWRVPVTMTTIELPIRDKGPPGLGDPDAIGL